MILLRFLLLPPSLSPLQAQLTMGDVINLTAVAIAFIGLFWSVLRAREKEREIREEAREKEREVREETMQAQQKAFEAIRTRLSVLETRDETTQKLIMGEVDLDRRLSKLEARQAVIVDFMMRRGRAESLQKGFVRDNNNDNDNH